MDNMCGAIPARKFSRLETETPLPQASWNGQNGRVSPTDAVFHGRRRKAQELFVAHLDGTR
jgi:hypothetical protein